MDLKKLAKGKKYRKYSDVSEIDRIPEIPSISSTAEVFMEVHDINNLLILERDTVFGRSSFGVLARDIFAGNLKEIDCDDLRSEIEADIDGILAEFSEDVQNTRNYGNPFMINMVIPAGGSQSTALHLQISEALDQSSFKEHILNQLFGVEELRYDSYAGRSEWLLMLLCNTDRSIIYPTKMVDREGPVLFCTCFIEKKDFVEAIDNFRQELTTCI